MRATEPVTAKAIKTTDQELVIILPDGEVRIPWDRCSPRLAGATADQRHKAILSPGLHPQG